MTLWYELNKMSILLWMSAESQRLSWESPLRGRSILEIRGPSESQPNGGPDKNLESDEYDATIHIPSYDSLDPMPASSPKSNDMFAPSSQAHIKKQVKRAVHTMWKWVVSVPFPKEIGMSAKQYEASITNQSATLWVTITGQNKSVCSIEKGKVEPEWGINLCTINIKMIDNVDNEYDIHVIMTNLATQKEYHTSLPLRRVNNSEPGVPSAMLLQGTLTENSHLPLSGKFVKTVGFSGIRQLIPTTAPVRLAVEGDEIKIPILVSEQTPINLLGRDALCKLKIKIWCSPLGVYVDSSGLSSQMYMQEECAKVYWLGHITEIVRPTFKQWEKCIQAQVLKESGMKPLEM